MMLAFGNKRNTACRLSQAANHKRATDSATSYTAVQRETHPAVIGTGLRAFEATAPPLAGAGVAIQ